MFQKSNIEKYLSSTQYPAYISNPQRHNIIDEILQTTEYGPLDKGMIGLNRLLKEGIFICIYVIFFF